MTQLKFVIYESDRDRTIRNRIFSQFPEVPDELIDRTEVYDTLITYLLQNSMFRGKNDGENNNGLRFVGSFTICMQECKILVYALPKYLCGIEDSLQNPDRYMFNIRRVIEKTGHLFDYEISETDFNPYYYNREQTRVGRYDMARWILNDYELNGIFTVREKKTTRDRRGRIDWNRTILKTTPVIDGEDVAYTSPISRYITRNDRLLLSDIHRCVIKEVLDSLGEEASDVYEPIYREELLGHLAEYVSVIRSFQRLVFAERDIILLRYLEAWSLYESNYYLKPVGTVSFDLVWEDLLRDVFGHKELQEKIGFGSPVYHIGKDYQLKGDSIPDAMNFWRSGNEVRFLIIDGKYYRGIIVGDKVEDLPGYKDVAKQIDYFDTLVNIYGLTTGCGKNVFVLPGWDGLCRSDFNKDLLPVPIRYVGYARKPSQRNDLKNIIEGLANKKIETRTEKDKVFIIQVEPDKLYRVFLDGVSDTQSYAEKLWQFVEDNYKASIVI